MKRSRHQRIDIIGFYLQQVPAEIKMVSTMEWEEVEIGNHLIGMELLLERMKKFR